MKPDPGSPRWRRVEEIFEAALTQPAAERASFLATACGDDPELHREVASLLAADLEAGSFLAPAAPPARFGARPAELPVLGRYRLVEEIGSGGSSTVYLALRADDEYRQRVAVKLLRTGFATPEAAARFRRERQILAALDHPNVCRLLDGGTTEQGLPFLVMERIEGVPLDRYVAEHELSLRARLELMLQVIDAVQYLHQNLIVHRDLKPANVLVKEGGTAKLLDFGIAKLLNPELGAALEPTRADLLLLTPSYASPEQIEGRPITTASDVYSLGVMLFRLLTGVAPYETGGGDVRELVRAVCELEPPMPSKTAAGRGAGAVPARELAGDLDHIVLKALAKKPTARYATAEQLAEDLRRFLQGLPVSVRCGAFSYRALRFVQRHRWGLAVAAVFFVLSGGFLAQTLVQQTRTARALAMAEREAAKASAVNAFLVEMLTTPDPLLRDRGREITVVEAIHAAEASLSATLGGQPEVEGAVHHVIGSTLASLGELPEAERHLRAALELRRQGGGRTGDLAETLLRLGTLLTIQGRLTESESAHREGLAITLAGERDVERAFSLRNGIAIALRRQGKLAEAAALWQEAAQAYRESAAVHDHPDRYAAVLNNLAITRGETGDYRGAAAAFGELLELMRQLGRAASPQYGQMLANLGLARLLYGDYDAARTALEEGLRLRAQTLGAEHPTIAQTRVILAHLLATQGDYAAAEEMLSETLAGERQRWGASHPDLSETLNSLAFVAWLRSDAEATRRFAAEAREILLAAELGQTEAFATAAGWLARAAAARGELAEAERLLGEARTIHLERVGERGLAVAFADAQLAELRLLGGRADAAVELYEHSLDRLEAALAPGHRDLLELRAGYARALAQLGRVGEAERQLGLAQEGAVSLGDPALRERLTVLGRELGRS